MKTTLYKIKQKVIARLKGPVDKINAFNQAYAVFQKTGETPKQGYEALLELYCLTNGKFNDTMNTKLISSNPPKKINATLEGVIGKIDDVKFKNINNTLNKDGYIGFDKKASPELVSRLYDYALKTYTKVAPLYDTKVIYDSLKPISEIYRFDPVDLVNNKDIQGLIMDPVLINIARNYLGCEPIFDFPAMWWSTTFLKEASEEAAQLYHFDLDRIKWLKIFIYLSDVTPENGPHRLIKGSHIAGAKPRSLLNRGYARIPDADIMKYHKPEDVVVVLGEAGSMFAEDTKCWHKGTPLKKGHRLVLEFEYTSSMFGTNYPKFELQNASEEFRNFCVDNPIYAANFILKN